MTKQSNSTSPKPLFEEHFIKHPEDWSARRKMVICRADLECIEVYKDGKLVLLNKEIEDLVVWNKGKTLRIYLK